MDKKNWGTKRLCECGKKFYDFNKNPILCPCGKVQTYEDKFAKLVAAKPVDKKKEIDPDAIADGEDFVAKEDQLEETVISLEDHADKIFWELAVSLELKVREKKLTKF